MSASLSKRSNGLRLLLKLAILLVCAILPQACKKAPETEPAPLVTVQAQHPQIGELSERIVADAMLSPLAQAVLSPKITAPVKAFYVQRGSRVKAGQLLARLENRDLAAQALDNKGQYTAAQAAFDVQTKAQIPEDYQKAELDMAQAKSQLQLQQAIAASRKKLLDEGAIAGRDYDTAVAALVQAKAAYDIAENHLASLQAVSQNATLQQAKGQLLSAKGKYLAAEAQVSYSDIRSPILGVVTDRPLFPGEIASAGSPLVTVMDTSSLIAKIHLSQAAAQRLSPGDAATVIIPGTEQPVPAKVSLISPALDPGSTTVEVWLRIENKNGKYKAGTPSQASITGRSVAHAVTIPLSAVLTAPDGTKSVMLIGSDGAAHKKAVELGINDGQNVQVTQGLNGSEMVITTGSYGIDEGTKVKIGKPDDAADQTDGEAK